MLSVRLRLIIFLVLMVPVLIYLGFNEARQTRTLQAPPSDAHQQSDYYIIEGRIRQFDEQGFLRQQLQSSQLEHQPALQQTLLVNPTLQLFDPSRATQTIHSRSGIVADSNELVTLAGDVTLQDNPDHTQASILQTESLLIYPKQERAETAEPVTLSAPHGTTTAVGMQVNTATGEIELLSDVKGIHHVN